MEPFLFAAVRLAHYRQAMPSIPRAGLIALLVTALASQPTLGSATEPASLAPYGKWLITQAEDSCRLFRIFGPSDDQVVLSLDQFAPGGSLELTLIGKRLGGLNTRTVGVATTFGPDLPKGKVKDAVIGTVGKDTLTPVLMASGRDLLNRPLPPWGAAEELLPPTTEQRAAVTNLNIEGRGLALTLQTGPMKPPLAAMDICLAKLVKTWGLDPVQQAALRKPAIPTSNPSRLLDSHDYPFAALFRERNAVVHFRIMVDASGAPTSCHVQSATESPDFDKYTCDLLMKRVRFSPALDSDGKPVASYYTNSVRWLAYD